MLYICMDCTYAFQMRMRGTFSPKDGFLGLILVSLDTTALTKSYFKLSL